MTSKIGNQTDSKFHSEIHKPDFNTSYSAFLLRDGIPVDRVFLLWAYGENEQAFVFIGNEGKIEQGKTYPFKKAEDSPGYVAWYRENPEEVWDAIGGEITFDVLHVEGRKAQVAFDILASDPLGLTSNVRVIGSGRFDGVASNAEISPPAWVRDKLQTFLARVD